METQILAIAIVIFAVISVFYCIYYSIVAPSLRMRLRYSFFELRDQLRAVRIEDKSEADSEAFHCLQSAFNSYIRWLFRVDVASLWEFHSLLKSDNTLRRLVEQRTRAVQECTNPELRRIYEASHSLVLWTILVNSLGFFVLIALPFLLIVVALVLVLQLRKAVSRIVDQIICLPESERGKLGVRFAS